MANRYSAAAKKARNLTNKQLGEELAVISSLSDAKLRELLPRKRDKEEFSKLMALVEKETKLDQQLVYLGDNIKTAGPVVLKLLKYFI